MIVTLTAENMSEVNSHVTAKKIAQPEEMKGFVNQKAFTKKFHMPFLPEAVSRQEGTALGMINAALATVVVTTHGGCAYER